MFALASRVEILEPLSRFENFNQARECSTPSIAGANLRLAPRDGLRRTLSSLAPPTDPSCLLIDALSLNSVPREDEIPVPHCPRLTGIQKASALSTTSSDSEGDRVLTRRAKRAMNNLTLVYFP